MGVLSLPWSVVPGPSPVQHHASERVCMHAQPLQLGSWADLQERHPVPHCGAAVAGTKRFPAGCHACGVELGLSSSQCQVIALDTGLVMFL